LNHGATDGVWSGRIRRQERPGGNSQVLLDSSGHDPHDVIRWVSDTAGEWVIGSHHYAGDDHKIERHRITSDSGVAVAGATEFLMQTSHVDVLAFEAVPSGVVMGFTDFNLQTAEAVALTPDPLAAVSHRRSMRRESARGTADGANHLDEAPGQVDLLQDRDTEATGTRSDFLVEVSRDQHDRNGRRKS
jgi:hypothetical protein